MSRFQRVVCTSVGVLLLAWGATVFAPPFRRPPPRQPRTSNPSSGKAGITQRPRRTTEPPPPADLRSLLSSKPTRLLAILAGPEARAPNQTARDSLARQAVEKIALQAETSKEPVKFLGEVREARPSTRELPADVREGLERVVQGLERRVLAEGLEEVGIRAERRQWDEVASKARASLTELGDAGLVRDARQGRDSAEFRVHLVEVRKLLGEARELAEQLAALQQLKTTLEGPSGASPATATAALARLDRAHLPGDLARRAVSLLGLAELRAAVARTWATAPDVAGLKQSVKRLEGALKDVPGADGRLGQKLLQELAVKAALEGHAAEAIELLPEGGPSRHAARLLRDVRALALGEGKVETAPARAAPSEPGKGPPGLAALLPPGARASWRPPVKGSASDLPPLRQAEKAGATVRAQLEKALPGEQAELETKAARTRLKMTALHGRILAPEKAERRQLAAVESELDRRLRPVERVKTRALLAQGLRVAQIARDLQASGDDNDEAEFLADVERRLGKGLDDTGRGQAKRLRTQGRTAAEVADVLGP